MKIAILTVTRTRSSYLLDVLCKAYEVPNLFEPYNATPHEYVQNFIKKDPAIIFDKYKKDTLTLTEEMFQNDSFGLKIMVGNFINLFKILPMCLKGNELDFTRNDLLDLEEVFRIRQYDKILILNRKNVTDSLISQYYANQVKKFLVLKSEKELIKHMIPKGKLYMSNSEKADEYGFQARMLSHLILEYLPVHLDKLGIPYTKLDYDDVPKFVESKYPNIESDYVDTEFDYKNQIANYKEIESRTLQVYNNCKEKFTISKLFV